MRPSLAERYLHHGGPLLTTDAQANRVHAFVYSHLAPPATAIQNPLTADRFSFPITPVFSITDYMKNGALNAEQLYLGASHLPSDAFWIEYPDDLGLSGLLCLATKDNPLMVVSVVEDPFHGKIYPMTVIDLHLGTTQVLYSILWSQTPSYRPYVDWDNSNLISALFILSVPRMCELRTAKTKPGKRIHTTQTFPAVEYKRVKLHIGHGAPRYERKPTESEAEYRRRLHHVTGHFRTLTHEYGSKGTKLRVKPEITWVAPHWRGDLDRGLLLKEQIIQTEPLAPTSKEGPL